MRWSRRSTALALGTAIGLVFALGGTFVPARVRAILPHPSAQASALPSAPPPPPPIPPPLPLSSTDLQLTELQMFGDAGWSIALHDESKGLVHVGRSGAELREVGPPNLLGWSFVDERTAFVVAKSSRMGSLVVYKTTDRGETFVASQLDVSASPVVVQGIALVDNEVGGLLASEDGSAATGKWAFLTADGGKSWRREPASTDLQIASPVGHQVWFVGDTGTMLGWNGREFRPILGFDDCSVYAFDFRPSPTTEIIEASCGSAPRLFHSRGDGRSWIAGATGVPDGRLAFADARHGFAWVDGPARVRTTSDGGSSWRELPLSLPPDLVLAPKASAWVAASPTRVFAIGHERRDLQELDRLVAVDPDGFTTTPVAAFARGEEVTISVIDRERLFALVFGSAGSRLYESTDGGRTFAQRFAE